MNSIYKRLKYLNDKYNKSNLIFLLFGLVSFIWFLVRVIPKPCRATYPCIRVTAPLASGFVVYLLGLAGSILEFYKAKTSFENRKRFTGIFALLVFFAVGSWFLVDSARPGGAMPADDQPVNTPIGEAQGLLSGRVVWVWNPDATNENCTLSYNGDGVGDENDDGWFLDKNNDQEVIDDMLSEVLRTLTSTESDIAAWDALFKYFNKKKHGLENTSYSEGEKIFIKTNATSSWGKGQGSGNITSDNKKVENQYYAIAETSPHLVLSVLRQLINVCGVEPSSIYVGDPMKHLYDHCYDKWHSEFSNVHYIANEDGFGREEVVPGSEPLLFYSDKQTVLDSESDAIYTVMEEADYMINIPTLKAHARAGITLFPKNHFGSHTRSNAFHLHPGLVAPDTGPPIRTDMSMYRVQVDLMGHELIGKNTLFFLLDALWSGSEAVDPPTKWDIAPFDGDWTSSLFASQDMVAIESVGFDFLKAEYDGQNGKVDYPNMPGTDDYLHQAADSSWWPEGISYDPEGDGTEIQSLGVHEHWNNSIDKQYTRDLSIGDGIEFIQILHGPSSIEKKNVVDQKFTLHQNYPNPFNPKTIINYELPITNDIEINIYNLMGQKVTTLVSEKQSAGKHQVEWNAKGFASGVYYYILRTDAGFVQTRKLMLLR